MNNNDLSFPVMLALEHTLNENLPHPDVTVEIVLKVLRVGVSHWRGLMT